MYEEELKDSLKNYFLGPNKRKKRQVYLELPLDKIEKLDSLMKQIRVCGFINVDRNSLIEIALHHLIKQIEQELLMENVSVNL